METDKEVIHQLRSGDIAAFESIFKAHYRALAVYANTILKDMDEAEDMVQQVFITLWEKRLTMHVHTSFKSLLYTSVYNACLNRIKQIQVRARYAGQVQFHTSEAVAAHEGIQQKELQQQIDAAMEKLPEQCARIFKMSRFEQLKYQEIADQLGLSVKTVENQMGKALKILREQLRDYLPALLFILSNYCID